ncbi:MAG: 1-acyl-sn-glycerol-3-phosphate acyltransferase [Clostridia bacterium]
MIVVYIIIILIAVLVLYIVFLAICAVVIDPKREYETDSRFYRFLINSAALCILKIVRIQVQTSGLEKIPNDTKPVFVCNHRSNFDPIITWYILRKWEPAFISKGCQFQDPVLWSIYSKMLFYAHRSGKSKKSLKDHQ